MYQISNEKFGLLVTELRKEKNLTQKELAEQLFVSDKTVSKWERGISMPSVALLIPIADALGVTVTELLRGEKMDASKSLGTEEVERLVVESLDLSVRDSGRRRKKKWILAYVLCLFVSIAEMLVLVVSGMSFHEMKDSVLLVMILMFIFGGWFCFFAKDLLPSYYDTNRISYVSQGFFNIHMAGLSFHNGNWSQICTAFKVWTLAAAITYPLIGILVIHVLDIQLWNAVKNILVWAVVVGMIGTVYWIGKRYE